MRSVLDRVQIALKRVFVEMWTLGTLLKAQVESKNCRGTSVISANISLIINRWRRNMNEKGHPGESKIDMRNTRRTLRINNIGKMSASFAELCPIPGAW